VLASRDHSAARSAAALGTCGASTSILNGYPAWTPDPDSRLARICSEAWKNMTGNDLEVTAIHAGLECGIINSLVPGMDSVSLGPDLHEVHSVTERVSVSSTARIAAFLRHLLEHMA
jgi:dipeptidase D